MRPFELLGAAGSRTIAATISAGVARILSDFDSPEQLLQLADERLYRAKKAGRNRVVVSDEQERLDPLPALPFSPRQPIAYRFPG